MALRGMFLQQVLLLVLIFLAATATSKPNSNCIDSCGSLSIPYPFGTSVGCYLDESFLITCNQTFETPKPFLRRGNIEVLNISLDGELRISTFVAHHCYNQSGLLSSKIRSELTLSNFPISNKKNKFTAVGCDTVALIKGTQGMNYTTGCISLCDSVDSVENGSCSGIGCCQTSIPAGVADFIVRLGSYNNYSKVLDFNPCGFAFVVEENAYSFSSLDLKNFSNRETVPVVLDWAVGSDSSETCPDAQRNSTSYACKAANSECYNSTNGPGYRCKCSSGFQGNPYLLHGCQGTNLHLVYYMIFFSFAKFSIHVGFFICILILQFSCRCC